MHLFRFAIRCPQRKKELLNRTWSDVNWKEQSLRMGKGKDGKLRYAPLMHRAMKTLREMKAQFKAQPEDRIFPMSANAVDIIWKALKQDLSIKDLHWHDLRHEGASQAAAQLDFDIALLQKVTGHKTLSQLRRYVNYSVREVHAKLARERTHTAGVRLAADQKASDDDAFTRKLAAQVAATLAGLGIQLPSGR